MDPRSHRLANTLAGNETDAAAIEMTIVGPEVEFDDERIAARLARRWVMTDGRLFSEVPA